MQHPTATRTGPRSSASSVAAGGDNMNYIIALQAEFFRPSTNLSTFKSLFNKLIFQIGLRNDSVSEYYLRVLQKKYDERIANAETNEEAKYLTLVWVLICAVGLLSNVYVIAVLSRVRQKIVYEIFCLGLALTDLSILLFAVPITTLHYGMRIWIFGDVICRLVNFLVYVAVFSSTMMLLVVTTTRFMAVVFPWQNRSFSIKMAKWACFIIWIVGATFSAPVLVFFGVTSGDDLPSNATRSPKDSLDDVKCQANFPSEGLTQVYFVLVFLLTYLLPFLAIIGMNALIVRRIKQEPVSKQSNSAGPEAASLRQQRSSSVPKTATVSHASISAPVGPAVVREAQKRHRRSRVSKIIILVTMLYCVCWLPTQIVNCWYYLSRQRFPKTRAMKYTKFLSQTLSFASACVNPIVYSMLSDTFKQQRHKLCALCLQPFSRHTNNRNTTATTINNQTINDDFVSTNIKRLD